MRELDVLLIHFFEASFDTLGETEKQTFQTWTVISTVVSVVGFLLACLAWNLLPYLPF